MTALPRAERADIDALTFQPIGRNGTMTWAQSLAANYTDGILILHRGRIVYERYFGVTAADRQHIAFSVTKSFVATVAATLIDEGVLDERATVANYLPELAKSGVRRCDHSPAARHDHGPRLHGGLHRSEVSGVGAVAGRRLPRASAGLQGPESFFDYLKTLTKVAPHGELFVYKTVEHGRARRRAAARDRQVTQRAAERANLLSPGRGARRVLHRGPDRR